MYKNTVNFGVTSAKISGEVTSNPIFSHTSMREFMYELTLKVRRLSGNCDLLPVIIPERLLGDIRKGDFLEVTAEIRTRQVIECGKNRLKVYAYAKNLTVYSEVQYKELYRADVNEVNLRGYVCKPIVCRDTPFGRKVADVMVAVNQPDGKNGKSYYVPSIVWGKIAVQAANISVGTEVTLSGRFQSREYEKVLPDGTYKKRITYEISAWNFCVYVEE